MRKILLLYCYYQILTVIDKINVFRVNDASSNESSQNLAQQDASQVADSDENAELPSGSQVVVTVGNAEPPRKRRRTHKRSSSICPEETEKIHDALAKMIAANQMPLTFAASEGFSNFMKVVKPGYVPCSSNTIKNRLKAMKTQIKPKIIEILEKAAGVSCTTDCWSSRKQEAYMTLTAHTIDEEWTPHSFTLSTREIDKRQNAANLSLAVDEMREEWGIQNKTTAVVTDNAKSILNAVKLLDGVEETDDVACAAHSIQLSVNAGLKTRKIKKLLDKTAKVVSHFKTSNVARYALKRKQEQLKLPVKSLLQRCNTRWNASFFMSERYVENRTPVVNVLADRTCTKPQVARDLEMAEDEWTSLESLIEILRPLQVLTTILCSDTASPTSMVRPLVNQIIQNFLVISETDDAIIRKFKEVVVTQLTKRFNLRWTRNSKVSARHIAEFLDSRYKDLEHEDFAARSQIRSRVEALFMTSCGTTSPSSDENRTRSTGLELIYNQRVISRDPRRQWEEYLAEPAIRFDMDPFEWWRSRKNKYPDLEKIARKYLCIPATSCSSERCFSTAGNIVSQKRSSLSPENVDILVFLYQNKKLLF